MLTRDGVEYKPGMTLYDYCFLDDGDATPDIMEYKNTRLDLDGDVCGIGPVNRLYGNKITILEMARDMLQRHINQDQQTLASLQDQIQRATQ
jgi:hypothetical protein